MVVIRQIDQESVLINNRVYPTPVAAFINKENPIYITLEYIDHHREDINWSDVYIYDFDNKLLIEGSRSTRNDIIIAINNMCNIYGNHIDWTLYETKEVQSKKDDYYEQPTPGYLIKQIKVKGDKDLLPDNIKKGINLFGVEGTFEGSGIYSILEVLSGRIIHVKAEPFNDVDNIIFAINKGVLFESNYNDVKVVINQDNITLSGILNEPERTGYIVIINGYLTFLTTKSNNQWTGKVNPDCISDFTNYIDIYEFNIENLNRLAKTNWRDLLQTSGTESNNLISSIIEGFTIDGQTGSPAGRRYLNKENPTKGPYSINNGYSYLLNSYTELPLTSSNKLKYNELSEPIECELNTIDDILVIVNIQGLVYLDYAKYNTTEGCYVGTHNFTGKELKNYSSITNKVHFRYDYIILGELLSKLVSSDTFKHILYHSSSLQSEVSKIVKGENIYGLIGTYEDKIRTPKRLDITPRRAEQTFNSTEPEYYKPVVCKGDDNLLPENIKSSITIFGVTGTWEGLRYVNETLTVVPTAAPQVHTIDEPKLWNRVEVEGDNDLVPENVRSGIQIFDVLGTAIIEDTKYKSHCVCGALHPNVNGFKGIQGYIISDYWTTGFELEGGTNSHAFITSEADANSDKYFTRIIITKGNKTDLNHKCLSVMFNGHYSEHFPVVSTNILDNKGTNYLQLTVETPRPYDNLDKILIQVFIE